MIPTIPRWAWQRCRPALLILFATAPAFAQSQSTPEPPKPTVILIRPAAAAQPALGTPLLPTRREQHPGNAATYYHRAIEQVLQSRSSWNQSNHPGPGKPLPESPEVKTARWSAAPPAEIPVEEARKVLQGFTAPLRECEFGAFCDTCDWGLDQRFESYDLLLPEIQDVRILSRLVILRARLAVLDGKRDEATHWIKVGLAMARQVGDGPTLIQALVGIAMTGGTLSAYEDLIQAPGTPSLYWSLTNTPRPFISMERSLDTERTLLERMLPRLDTLGTETWTRELAQQTVNDLMRRIELFTLDYREKTARLDLKQTTQRLALATLVAKVYPQARRALIASGRTAAEVDAMPALQVSLLHTYRVYANQRDDMYKWTSLPYYEGYRQLGAFTKASPADNPMLAMLQLLMPAINSAKQAEVRLDRRLAALRAIEAIRMHAAAGDGQLPASLGDVAVAPIPLDPATGKPFEYERAADGKSAQLKAPVIPGGPNHPSFALHYNLRLAPSR
ncbi:MAG: hypothetical protein U0794_15580 [Isosphaeraceae bacterium]